MVIPFADTIFWIAVVSCLVAQIAIVRSVLRMRGEIPANGLPRPRAGIEIAWVIVPAIVLAAVLGATWQRIHRTTSQPATPASSAARVANESPSPSLSSSPSSAGSASAAGGSTP